MLVQLQNPNISYPFIEIDKRLDKQIRYVLNSILYIGLYIIPKYMLYIRNITLSLNEIEIDNNNAATLYFKLLISYTKTYQDQNIINIQTNIQYSSAARMFSTEDETYFYISNNSSLLLDSKFYSFIKSPDKDKSYSFNNLFVYPQCICVLPPILNINLFTSKPSISAQSTNISQFKESIGKISDIELKDGYNCQISYQDSTLLLNGIQNIGKGIVTDYTDFTDYTGDEDEQKSFQAQGIYSINGITGNIKFEAQNNARIKVQKQKDTNTVRLCFMPPLQSQFNYQDIFDSDSSSSLSASYTEAPYDPYNPSIIG